MDRLRAFEVFAAVIARGSFVRAAEALDTSPANVTRYINELETHLGTRLLNRSSRKLSLTESGEILHERCRLILEEVAEAETQTSATATRPRGRMRINVPVSFGILQLAPLWPQFMDQYPEVELDIVLAERPKFLQALFNRGVVLRSIGRRTDAVAAFRAFIAAAPNDPRVADAKNNISELGD